MTDTLDLRPPQRSTRGMIGVPTTLTASLLDADGEPKEAEAVDLYIGGPISASWPLPDPLGDVTKITGTLDEETGLWMLAVPGLSAGTVLLRLVVDGALVGRLLHHVGSEGSASPTTELVVRDGADLVLHLSTAITAPGDLATVATTGDYDDLSGKPSIPATAADVDAVPTTRTVAGKALSADVTLDAADVGADPEGTAADAVAGLDQVDDGRGVRWDASAPGILRPDLIIRRATAAHMGNTTAKTTVLSFPIDSLAADDYFDLHGIFFLSNTGGGAIDWTFRLEVGASTLSTFTFAALPQGATRTVRFSAQPYVGEFLGSPAWQGSALVSVSGPGGVGADSVSATRPAGPAGATIGSSTPLLLTAQASVAHASAQVDGAGFIRRSRAVA